MRRKVSSTKRVPCLSLVIPAMRRIGQPEGFQRLWPGERTYTRSSKVPTKHFSPEVIIEEIGPPNGPFVCIQLGVCPWAFARTQTTIGIRNIDFKIATSREPIILQESCGGSG